MINCLSRCILICNLSYKGSDPQICMLTYSISEHGTYNSNTCKTERRNFCVFKGSLGYTGSSREAWKTLAWKNKGAKSIAGNCLTDTVSASESPGSTGTTSAGDDSHAKERQQEAVPGRKLPGGVCWMAASKLNGESVDRTNSHYVPAPTTLVVHEAGEELSCWRHRAFWRKAPKSRNSEQYNLPTHLHEGALSRVLSGGAFELRS